MENWKISQMSKSFLKMYSKSNHTFLRNKEQVFHDMYNLQSVSTSFLKHIELAWFHKANAFFAQNGVFSPYNQAIIPWNVVITAVKFWNISQPQISGGKSRTAVFQVGVNL